MLKTTDIFVSFILVASAVSARESYYDYIYHNNASSLYDQDSLPLNATPDEREREFLRRKSEGHGLVVMNAIMPIMTGVAIYEAHRWWPRAEVQPQVQPAPMPLGGLVFFFSTLISGTMQTILQPHIMNFQEYAVGVVNSAFRWFMGVPRDNVQQLEIQYVRNKPSYSGPAPKAIEWHFEKIRKRFAQSPMQDFSVQREDPSLVFLNNSLGLPTSSKELSFDDSAMKSLFAQYEGMMSGMPLAELGQFARSQVRASKMANPKLKASLYLEGPPGTGKTEAVEKLGQLLGIPVIKINLSEFRDISDLKGKACQFSEDSQCHPGEIARRLIGLSSKNAIVFFDEADQVLNRIHEGQNHPFVSMMLEFLEGKTKTIYNPYFGFEIDVSHLGIILAGNTPLKNSALVSRLNNVYFGNYTVEYRKRAGRQRFIPEILESYQGALSIDNLTDEDWEKIDKIAEQEKDPGFRSQMRALEHFIHQKVTK